MKKVADLIPGQRFGRWVVVRKTASKRTSYLCRCDCGTMRNVRRDSLLNGGSLSCGCSSAEALRRITKDLPSPRRASLAGKRFGQLTVLSYGFTRDNRAFWNCRCDCGNTKAVSASDLIRGATASCGCLATQNIIKCISDRAENDLVEGSSLSSLTQRISKNNVTGVKGVYRRGRDGKYIAHITFQGKRYYLGQYSDLNTAAKARSLAEEKFFHPLLEKYGRDISADS